MALVFRAPKLNDKIEVKKVGPGYYQTQAKTNNKKNINQSSIFLSKTVRDPFQIKKQQLDKKIQKKQQEEKKQKKESQQIINKSQNKCTSPFKSKVQRFQKQKEKIENKNYEQLTSDFKQLMKKEGPNVTEGKLLKLKDKKAIQQILNEKYQHFPSIPDWQKSYGYKIDPLTKKLVSNQNPNILLLTKEEIIPGQKINCTLGPGYYFVKSQKSNKSMIWKKPQQPQLPSLNKGPNILIPSNSHRYNTIQGQLSKLRLQKKSLNYGQTYHYNLQNINIQQNIEDLGQRNRKKLLMNKMLKKYGEYINQAQKKEPQKLLQKMLENKQSVVKYNKNNQNGKQFLDSPKHFLAKNQRFKQDTSSISSPQKRQKSQEEQIHSPKLSHSIKQSYAVGQVRFKQRNKQNLGPASYNQKNSSFSKAKGTIKLNSKRFDDNSQGQYLPGPGSYIINKQRKKIDPNVYQQIHNQIKEKHMTLSQPHLKNQESMQSLYQNWGRHMNYLVKKQAKIKQLNQKKVNSNELIDTKIKDITQTRNILQKSAKLYKIQSQKKVYEQKLEINQYKPILKSKHIYSYKPQEDKQAEMFPGKYEICKDLNKKTFNVTYDD